MKWNYAWRTVLVALSATVTALTIVPATTAGADPHGGARLQQRVVRAVACVKTPEVHSNFAAAHHCDFRAAG
jgi:hypothetical protein